MLRPLLATTAALLLCAAPAAQSRAAVRDAIERAVRFFGEQVQTHGGFVYRYSADLSLREAEGIPGPDTIWIQPPGTPLVGAAFLDAWQTTGSEAARDAARRAARALVLTQLHSGGWHYHAGFAPAARRAFAYRRTLDGEPTTSLVPEAERTAAGGWPVWKRRRYGPGNQTILDDDVTQAALRFLIRIDGALDGADAAIHDAVEHGLGAVLGTQYPNGAWSANWDRYPRHGSPSAEDFPVVPARCPEDWPREWTKAFRGCYVTNDDLHADTVALLLLAWQTYGDERHLEAARRAGEFLLRAQLPDPQPAWAQAYDVEMHPVWDRPFEPPAVSGLESQRLCACLLQLHDATGEERFLDSAARALDYLRGCHLDDDTLPRFRALRSDRPLYFRRGPEGRGHVLTHERGGLASNYAFVVPSRVAELTRALRARRDGEPPADEPVPTAAEIRHILRRQDARGAWTEPGTVRDAEGRKTEPEDGIIRSETFARNLRRLCAYLRTRD